MSRVQSDGVMGTLRCASTNARRKLAPPSVVRLFGMLNKLIQHFNTPILRYSDTPILRSALIQHLDQLLLAVEQVEGNEGHGF
jgi:hypothetical protein